MNGPQRGTIDLTFAVPSVCADRVIGGDADIGLIPVIEMPRHGFDYVKGIGIACRGPVRSILLLSKKPFEEIRTLAADSGSRTSVQLARIILGRKFNAWPMVVTMAPDVERMLEVADAALIIGDAALALDPSEIDLRSMDLGEEWVELSGLPMVFAVWAGRKEHITERVTEILRGSCHFGLGELDAIIKEEAERRGFPEHVVHQYLTRNVTLLLGEEEEAGLRLYLEYAAELDGAGPRWMEKRSHDDAAASR